LVAAKDLQLASIVDDRSEQRAGDDATAAYSSVERDMIRSVGPRVAAQASGP